jgi:signal peptidase II
MILALVLILDRISKYMIKLIFPLDASMDIIKGIFSLTYVQNTGVSFGLFKGLNFLFIIVSIVALGLFYFAFKVKKKYSLQFGLICAGITGNLIDRIIYGYVVDFFNLHFWAIFNVSDAAISVGLIWLVILLVINNEDLF